MIPTYQLRYRFHTPLQNPHLQAAHAEEVKKVEEEEVTKLRRRMVHRANRVGEFKKQQYEDIS